MTIIYIFPHYSPVSLTVSWCSKLPTGNDPTITSQPIGSYTDPFVQLGHYSLQHQWDSNHTSSPGEKPGALILADQNGHACVYATLPYYLIRDTTLHRGFIDTIFIKIHFQIFRNWILSIYDRPSYFSILVRKE